MDLDKLETQVLGLIAECDTPSGNPAAVLGSMINENCATDHDVFALLWMFTAAIADMYKDLYGHTEHCRSFALVFAELGPDGHPRPVDADHASPDARAFGRWFTAALNRDTATGHAIFNTLSNPNDHLGRSEFGTRLLRAGQAITRARLTQIRQDGPK